MPPSSRTAQSREWPRELGAHEVSGFSDEQKAPCRVLVLYSALPGEGSEPGVGWGFLLKYAELCTQRGEKLIVLIRADHANACRKELELRDLLDNVELMELATEFFGIRPPHLLPGRLKYLFWRKSAMWKLTNLRSSHSIVSVHQPTWASAILPPACPNELLPRFIWGPVAIPTFSGTWNGRVLDRLVKWLASLNRKRIKLVVALNQQTFDHWTSRPRFGQSVILEPHVFVEPRSTLAYDSRLIAVVGQLVPRKCVKKAIEVLGEPALEGYDLEVIGDGPLRRQLWNLTKQMGLENRVRFIGRVAREEALWRIGRAAVLFHPAKREGAGFVVAEATAMGVPVVTFSDIGSATIVKLAKVDQRLVQRDKVSSTEIAVLIHEAASLPRIRGTSRWSIHRLDELLPDWWRKVAIGQE